MPFDDGRDPGFVGGIAFKAIAWAALFLLVGAGGDYVATRFGLERDLLFVNDVVSAAMVIFLIITYERRRRRRIRERLEVIQLMNHHVRNALQVIALSPHSHEREENVAMIRESVARIEWALREILPGGMPEELQEKEKLRTATESHPHASHT
ncbi:MAG: hypothetical protein JWN45_1097 [Acidobacteriaceae bacterium]|nr:hypothetical protein [Acidobacteriaceae bacterium]